MQSYVEHKDQAILLRKKGATYAEIKKIIGVTIPLSTLSEWFKGEMFSTEEALRIQENSQAKIQGGILKAAELKKIRRENQFLEIYDRLSPLADFLADEGVAKIVLMVLYWCEGAKNTKGSLAFGNSDPAMIQLFIGLLRRCYLIDEQKFRCTVQCRVDQDPNALAIFWSEITNISLKKFYRPQIDPRTMGKPSKKSHYKGVCRIDYFSASIYHELTSANKILRLGL